MKSYGYFFLFWILSSLGPVLGQLPEIKRATRSATAAGAINETVSSEPETSDLWLTLPGKNDANLAGHGKRIVLISGDEEYRSEEALPMLAKILAEHHGFTCNVLFSINPTTGTVDPNWLTNIPGLHLLDKADALILFIRMRSLPDSQMAQLEKFFKAGKPFMAIRTSTHPFAYGPKAKTSFRHWSFDHKEGDWVGGFGRKIIGETWVSHHGIHNGQATRGIISESSKDSPILRGVTEVFGPTDVYGVVHLPETATILMRGQVVDGMKPSDPPLAGPKNDPMMPLVWTKEYQFEGGEKGKVLCTTMGSAVDFENEGLRRLVINTSYWMVGKEMNIPEKADVPLPATYKPSYFGFKKEADHFIKLNIKPFDLLPK